MASFDRVNYSLRPSKTIERALAFEGFKRLGGALGLRDQVYIGLGSIWFTDFQLAHRHLGINDMISMECDEIGFARAKFNTPFKTVRLINKRSSDALPELFVDSSINSRPWVVWLDYDKTLEEGEIADIYSVIENAPTNSLFLVTLDVSPDDYGKPKNRVQNLLGILGSRLDVEPTADAVVDEWPEIIARALGNVMVDAAVAAGRPGGFLPAFRMVYEDTATMLTVGGVLPAPGARSAVREELLRKDWPAFVQNRIVAPHLTLREAGTLQSQLPSKRKLTRASIRKLGFDLHDEQLDAFERYYKLYPSFAQVTI